MTLSLVTGGNGFVGRHIVDALRERGDDVRVLDLGESGTRDDIDYRRVDITDAEAVREALEGVDTIFHNASLVHTKNNRIEDVRRVNFDGTLNMLRAAREHGVGRFVYVSSGSVVYEGKDIKNGDERLPYASGEQAPYIASKIEAEKAVLADNDAELRTVAIRPHVIFGPGDTRFLPALLKHAQAGRLRVQVGRGTWLSDYTYIDNLIDALLLADQKLANGSAETVSGNAYFVTNGEPMPFWDFVREVVDKLELPPIRFKVPHQLVYAIAAVKETLDTWKGGTLNNEDGLSRFAIRYMCTHHYFSIDKARADLGYEPLVSVAEGIDRTCAHLREIGAV